MIRERCSCGAEFETNQKDASRLLNAWRKNHRCRFEPQFVVVDSARSETAPDAIVPEMHIGFRADPNDE